MSEFLGQPITAQPRVEPHQRLQSLGWCVLVALPLAPIVLIAFSLPPAIALIVGAAIAGWLCVTPRVGPIDRGTVVSWGFSAAVVTGFVDMALRSVVRELAGHYWYWPKLDRDPHFYVLVVGLIAVVYAVLLWAPLCLLGYAAARVARRRWRRPAGVAP